MLSPGGLNERNKLHSSLVSSRLASSHFLLTGPSHCTSRSGWFAELVRWRVVNLPNHVDGPFHHRQDGIGGFGDLDRRTVRSDGFRCSSNVTA